MHGSIWRVTRLVLDTMSIVPGSIHVFANGLACSPFLNTTSTPIRPTLTWNIRPSADSVLVRYRVMPIAFAHKCSRTRTPTVWSLRAVTGSTRSGTSHRSRIRGPVRNARLNQIRKHFPRRALREQSGPCRELHLEPGTERAHLTDRIQVLASITDNNIPIQAGGNTLELQDFDQVFIKLFEGEERTGGRLIAGDFVLQRPKSHFLTYLKKTKGLSFETPVPYGGT